MGVAKFLPHDLNKCRAGSEFLGLICRESSFIVIMQLITGLSRRFEFSKSFLFLNTFGDIFKEEYE